MATAKKSKPTVKKTAVRAGAKSKAAPKAAKSAKPAAAPMKPIKEAFNKTGLTSHLAETSGVEPKAVKAVMAALEATVLASVNKKGAGAFVLPGLLKVTATAVPAKKERKGINPFTKEETIFKAKPATTKLKVRPLKKLKDAAL
ncbi:HU family DNA-binding protein [Ramlibacter humi]|uniref:DNA-binding protein n=1 Tax=Ramlibacter humi TaxID=2530451 RepID=A0A4Z0CEV7_9BURK|nr:HU family DNA-binding protein [Ramlibacter humi]TFZ09055.1 DNA-binding protein [Ramlibacter humi]